MSNSELHAQEQQDEISFTVLDAKKDHDIVLQKLATAINVRMSLQGAGGNGSRHTFPLVQLKNFAKIINLTDKLFIYGPSGIGKSRCIIEIISQNVENFSKIYVINPRNATVGIDSGRASLSSLSDRFNENDAAVVWDNFPDNLIKRDIVNAQKVLEVISSKDTSKLIVSLKPKYLEVFKELIFRIPEFYTYEISYELSQIKDLVRTYGTNIPIFKETYENYVKEDIESISKTLWRKEPSPLTVLDFYNELGSRMIEERRKNTTTEVNGNDDNNDFDNDVANDNNINSWKKGRRRHLLHIDAVWEAEQLLRSTNYYEHQFGLMNYFQNRKSETDFLYILKVCYDIGLERNYENIKHLQKGIFNSLAPAEPYKNLSTWIYLSGQFYSMHDVCKDAVKLTDEVKAKILSYLSDRFLDIITNETNHNHQFGVFLGKNIQFIPRDQSYPFLPDNIYKYMKKSVEFERAFGQGVGEVFDSLDDDLQYIILERVDTEIEFAPGMAETLGYRFRSLEDRQRKQVLDKIYSAGLFARYFGQSIGRLFKYLPENIRNDIFHDIEHNGQFADGVGMGIGYIFYSLDQTLQNQILIKAKTNSEMNRGLGYGMGLNFRSLDAGLQKKALEKGELNSEFDKGIAMGLAMLFKYLPSEFQDTILRRGESHPEFIFGLGLYTVFASFEHVPKEIMLRIDIDGELAYGLGMGFGIYYSYFSDTFQKRLFDNAKNNIKLDLGLGSGFGIVFKHLPFIIQQKFLMHADQRNEFDIGIGFGIGYSWGWRYLERKLQDQVFARCNTNNRFAYGLGYGLGYVFRYFSPDVREGIFERADKNSEFDRGLGFGLGYSFPYLDEFYRDQVFARCNTNNRFAYGLGSGLGRIFKYLSEEIKKDVYERANKNSEFDRGLGFGLGGYAIMYMGESFEQEVFSKISQDHELAFGIGSGLGYSFRYLDKRLKRKAFDEILPQNSEFARGLGFGLGYSFKYLESDLKEKEVEVLKLAEKNIQFAVGLGEGLGHVFTYLDNDFRQNIYEMAIPDSGLARGLGLGIGSTFTYLSADLKQEVLKLAEKNIQLARGLGFGLGYSFKYLESDLKEKEVEVLKLAEKNIQFAVGLGEGLGHVFTYVEANRLSQNFENADAATSFMMGLGIGYGKSLSLTKHSIDKDDENIFSKYLYNNVHFQKGLGLGIGSTFTYLSANLKQEVLKLAKNNQQHFEKTFVFGLGHIFSYINDDDKGLIRNIKDQEFTYFLGRGLGHSFLSLNQHMQQELIRPIEEEKEDTNDNGSLGRGITEGLDYSFPYMDKGLQEKISGLVNLSRSDSHMQQQSSSSSSSSYQGNSDNHHLTVAFQEFPVVGCKRNYDSKKGDLDISSNSIVDKDMKEYLKWILDECHISHHSEDNL
jgi:hypothetical protein